LRAVACVPPSGEYPEGVPRVPLEYRARFSHSTCTPPNLGWPQRPRTAKRSGRLATASSACHTETGWRRL
jgi:hypothetical protein